MACVMVMFFALLATRSEAHGTHSALMTKVDERLAEKPDDAALWYQRAVLQFEHEDYAAAANDFAKVEKFAPGEYPVLWWQGRIFEFQGKLPEGKAAIDQFLIKMPNHWGALASRARLQMKLGAKTEALTDFRAALTNCPDPQPDLIQEVTQALASNGQVDEAVGVLEARMQKIGPIPSLQMKLLEIEVEADRYDDALSRLNAYEKGAPRKEPWMEKRAIILAQAGSVEESQAAWSALLAHLNSLPLVERNSHAMTLLAERARQALVVLRSSKPSLIQPFTNTSTHQHK